MKDVTMVLGASLNEERYANIAIKRLRAKKYPVVAIGVKKGMVADVSIATTTVPWTTIDTVTLYLNPKRQEAYYDYILSLQPKRVIFNPGTENVDFATRLQKQGIVAENACTLVLLSTNQY